MSSTYTDDRAARDAAGAAFVEFATAKIEERTGIRLDYFDDMHRQFNIGETAQGFEFKNDRRCNETGRISVEYYKKINGVWYVSTTFRAGLNTQHLVHGNESVFFVYETGALHQFLKSRKLEGARNSRGEVWIMKRYLSLQEAADIAKDVYVFEPGLIRPPTPLFPPDYTTVSVPMVETIPPFNGAY